MAADDAAGRDPRASDMTHLLVWECVEPPERSGRVIRHAGALACAIGALVVAMIEASFGALLVSGASCAPAVDACRDAAPVAAVDVAAVAVATDREQSPAQTTGQQQVRCFHEARLLDAGLDIRRER